jgi:hypothetical protein
LCIHVVFPLQTPILSVECLVMFVHSHTMFWIGVAGIHDELELWPTLLLCGRASNTGGQPIAIGVASAGNAGAGDADCQDLAESAAYCTI